MIVRIMSYIFVCLLISSSVSSVDAQTGKDSIENLIKVFADLRGHHWELDPQQLSEAAKYIDYQAMAQRALGEKEWQKLSHAQKISYLQSFKFLTERRYYTRWHRIFAHSKIAYGTEERKEGDLVVNTKITTDKSIKSVAWTLVGEPPKVINLTVDDRDMLKHAQARFQNKIASAGVPAFLAWLQKKSKQASSEDETDFAAEPASVGK